jgi:chaperonin GroEL
MKLREKTNVEIAKENGVEFSFLTNVVEEKSTKAKIRATLQVISKILCGTLGPYGTTTIIQDREMKHFATKDGYDLMNRINFNDEISRTILDLVRQVASNQVLTVGDGSTSAIVVSEALFSAITDPELKLFDRIAPKDILDALNDISEFLEKELKLSAKPISKNLDELEIVAMISTNNDRATGKLIKEIYQKIGEFGFISTDIMEKKDKDSYIIKQGIEWGRGYIDDYFVKGYNNKKIIHDKEPRVFLTNSYLTFDDIEILLSEIIGDVCGKQKAELVIVANGFDEDVKTFLKANRTRHIGMTKNPEMIFSAVDIDQVTETGRSDIEDLGALLGCEVYDKLKHKPAEYLSKPDRFIGRAEKIIITGKSTQIIGKTLDETREIFKNRKVELLKEKLNEKLKIENTTREDDFDIYQLKRRISSLTDSTAVIYIAGKSLTERMTRERLFEDAILACKSAIKYGVILGGNISIPKIIDKKRNEILLELTKKYSYLPVENIREFFNSFLDIFKNAFLESYKNVLNNSYFNENEVTDVINKCMNEDVFYNLKLHKYENIYETSVINSVDTDIQILKSVISIIGIMATSNQMITMNFNVSDHIVK